MRPEFIFSNVCLHILEENITKAEGRWVGKVHTYI